MPNKLSDAKMRKTLTEHKSVIAILDRIAQDCNTTTMELMRKAIRNEIRMYARQEAKRDEISGIIKEFEPKISENVTSPTDIAKFKCKQRDFDRLLLELDLETPESIEKKNSLIPPASKIRVLELETQHA